jgi:agmatine deiminase
MHTASMFLCLVFLLLAGKTMVIAQAKQPLGSDYYPTFKPRMVAEWEPAVGVLVTWPLSIPKELVVDLANDTKLYLLVDSHKGKQEAIQHLTKWKITPDQVKFITAPQGPDASWTRDWGPHGVFTPEGAFKMVDPRYLFATPLMGMACDDSLRMIYFDDQGRLKLTQTEDQATGYIAAATERDAVAMPFAFTGGNVLNDGQRAAFSTCALVRENEFDNRPKADFVEGVRKIMGIEDYHILSNYEEHGIQHIDCFMKLLDEERILVARPPADHPSYPIYEAIVNEELTPLTNAYGRPYQILRIDLARYKKDELAAYTNALILNKNIYVPLFNIAADSAALKTWREAMPGYRVRGYSFPLKPETYYREKLLLQYGEYGWTFGDALHCRTRAMWDTTMIYLSVDRIPQLTPKAKSYIVNVIIKDYSKGSLVPEKLKLHWRIKGEPVWKEITLKPTGLPDQYQAVLQGNFAGVTVEYFAEARSNWGTQARMPITAPEVPYSFRVN